MDLSIIYMVINSKVFNRHLKLNVSQIELLILSSKPVLLKSSLSQLIFESPLTPLFFFFYTTHPTDQLI